MTTTLELVPVASAGGHHDSIPHAIGASGEWSVEGRP